MTTAESPPISRLQAIHDPYFVQRVKVSTRLSSVPRTELFRQLFADKSVLHVGYADWPITNADHNLHIALDPVCRLLDGVDPHSEAADAIRPYVRGRLFRELAEVKDFYDYLFVPEVIEHVGDLAQFFSELDRVRFGTVVITAPDAFSCMNRHFEMVRDDRDELFFEVVHPDHNCWFTPFTLRNLVSKHTPWSIMDPLYFINGISLMLIAKKSSANQSE